MASFPSYIKLGWKDIAEAASSVVVRSDMSRGVAKQRRTQADTVVSVQVTAYFSTASDANAFEAWFYGAGGMGWFDFTHPRTGAVVQARIVGGDIGALSPVANPTWSHSQRQFKLEYVKPAL